ncbi:Bug family tripartite tricarboxylate transporter substrate binding protein [Polynucleobacter kasalickyi]|uniref:Tripartite-type tricarboxylate transporter, receptor component TctC n=1 Tax=Polynucleobacter kasalickyi TaxID=1938817 RepID=A0A1W1Z5P6_9BURK|nr:tripartite tricarboxylate transporter substrate binding protein [Polynucleobacter kasalickyi]SMC43797.1 Tripartite-type tricarboxylate transporter, receptor component TctC [Polynucleobacter kasalickyi]
MKKNWLIFSLMVWIGLSSSSAQEYPNRPVKMLTGYPAGSSVDLYGRAISSKLQKVFKQPFVFENKVGAAGTIAAEATVRAPADGYTLLNTASQITINPFVQKLSFNTEKDLIPVAQTLSISYILLVGPDFPAKNLSELIEVAKSNPKKFNYGSYGNGSGPHLAMAMLKKAANIDVTHIQYRGSGQMLTALMAGEIQMAFDTTTATLELIKAGKLIPLATGGSKVLEALPNLPTIAQKYPGFDADGWQGVFVPAGTPSPIVSRLNLEINKIIQEKEFRDLANSRGVIVTPGSQEQFTEFVKSELKKYEQVVRENNIYLE